MELLDRYLQAVGSFLFKKDKEDILRELRESLLSRMEEKEQGLGHPLTADEVAAIIEENGPPFIVAARYGPHRSLIGPTLFPFYWQALKWALLSAFILRLIVAVFGVLLSANAAAEIVSTLLAVPGVVVPVFAWVTAVFAGMEFALSMAKVKPCLKWNPRSLPKLRNSGKMVPRHESVAAVVFGLAGLVWMRAVAHSHLLILGPTARFLLPAPIWTVMYWPLMILAMAGILQSMVMLVKPYWSAFMGWSRAVTMLGTLIIAWVLFAAGNWLVLANGVEDRAHWEAIAAAANRALYYSFAVSVVFIAGMFAWQVYQLLRNATARLKKDQYPANGLASGN